MAYKSILYFAKNKQINLFESTLVSHTIFYDLTNGSIVANSSIKLNIQFCIFEEVIKEGKGACIQTENNDLVTISKCAAKSCGVFTPTEKSYAGGHFCYLETSKKEKSIEINGVSLLACATSINCNQRSIIRASKTNSDCFDSNITNSYSSSNVFVFRQYDKTNFKRIILNRIITCNSLLYFEYGSVFVEKMDISDINISVDETIIYLAENSLTFTDCLFNTSFSKIVHHSSQTTFENCYFVQNAPWTNGVQFKNNVTSFQFGDLIIGGGKIFKEIDEMIRNKAYLKKFRILLLNILFLKN